MKHTIILIFLLISPNLSFSKDIELAPIIIQKDSGLEEALGKDYIKGIPFHSLEEILEFNSGLELRSRGLFGIQQDLSIRGASFENNFVYLNGVKINDPQTGHFSLQLPLTEFDLEKIIIDKSSLKLKFKTCKPKERGFNLKTYFGQHGLWGKIVSLNFPISNTKNRLSFEHRISSGARQDTDFDIYSFVLNSLLQTQAQEWEILVALQKKDFGADSFYSANYPHQEEHIKQSLFQLKNALERKNFAVVNNFYFRRHQDKFILNRHNPPFYTNYHTTYIWGLNSDFNLYELGILGFVIEKEKITSTRLDRHSRIEKEIHTKLSSAYKDQLIFEGEAALSHIQGYDWNQSLDLSFIYRVRSKLSLFFSYNHLFRMPSFTELYYTSPANIGNSSLDVEKIDNFETGFAFWGEILNLNLSLFLRNHRDAIDWVRDDISSAWQATNIGSLKVGGLDLNLTFKLNNTFINQLSVGYTYLDSEDNPYNFSKYLFDYLKHKVVFNIRASLLDFDLSFSTIFSKPLQRKEFTTCDLKLTKNISDQLSLFIEGTNIFNKDYYELTDVEGSPRWYKIGLEYKF
jgi:iron complex outermembrane receptor protein